MRSVLFVHDEEDTVLARELRERLRHFDVSVVEAYYGSNIPALIRNAEPHLAIMGPAKGEVHEGLRVARQIRVRDRMTPLVLVSAHSSVVQAVEAMRAGFNDYLEVPFSSEELFSCMRRNLRMHMEPPGQLVGRDNTMVGKSRTMCEIKSYLVSVAAADCNVLITGETGTGKELAAELIRANSQRREEPFVCINCTAIPESLLESELFGYERGAFTGAYSDYAGRLKAAEGGTVFLDEIGDMNLYAQAKLLRVIENKEFYRVRGNRPIPLDVRFIAAANQNPERLVEQGKLREDLYYRLNVIRIHMPPLRERKEDIPLLTQHFIRDLRRRFQLKTEGVTTEVLSMMLSYDWPGNIRELRNLLEATFVSRPSTMIAYGDLPMIFRRRIEKASISPRNERDLVLSALFSTNWNKTRAAQKLNWSRMTLYRKMAKYDILSTPK